jgi:hypothetical protein
MLGLGKINRWNISTLDLTFFFFLKKKIIRDNVYSIYCVFGLALAYRRIDDTTGRACKLFVLV